MPGEREMALKCGILLRDVGDLAGLTGVQEHSLDSCVKCTLYMLH